MQMINGWNISAQEVQQYNSKSSFINEIYFESERIIHKLDQWFLTFLPNVSFSACVRMALTPF